MHFLTCVILFVVTVVLYLYWSFKKAHRFFLDRNIPSIEPHPVFGNMKDVILRRTSLAEIYLDFYRKLAPHPFGGIYMMKKPMIVVRDPDLIKNILIKDFAFFPDRGINTAKDIDPLTHHLFTMKGDDWRNLRIKLTGTFTSAKMKLMFPLVRNCGEKLCQVIEQIPNDETFDAKDLSARYTTDTIGSCAFGLETNSLNNPDSEFRIMGNKTFDFRYATIIRTLWPNMPKKLIKLFNLTVYEKEVQDYFMDIVDRTVKYREQNKVTRNDFLDLMIGLKNDTILQNVHDTGDNEDLKKLLDQLGDKRVKSDIEMTNDLLATQAFEFFRAGFETSSTALGYVLLELSRNQTVQDKTRQEIRDVLSANDGKLTYEVFKQMTYTDMVIDETLRKYPPAAIIIRATNENYKVPNTEVIIPAGTSVIIPVYGVHLDESYYDNPDEFRPERFTEEEKAKRPNYSYLPFGNGPRVCIAERFAKLQVKIGLIYAIKDFSYLVSPEMKFPIKVQLSFGILSPIHGILLQKRDFEMK